MEIQRFSLSQYGVLVVVLYLLRKAGTMIDGDATVREKTRYWVSVQERRMPVCMTRRTGRAQRGVWRRIMLWVCLFSWFFWEVILDVFVTSSLVRLVDCILSLV